MDNQDKLTKDMEYLQGLIKAELENSWKEGFKSGAVLTCATLYGTFMTAGLEETNILYAILKDFAAKNGCDDLPTYAKNMINKGK